MIKILKLTGYTIPMYGNSRIMPYGKLTVEVDGKEYTSSIKEDGANQYITANRKRYYVINIGSVYNPHFISMDEYNQRQKAKEKSKEKMLDILKGMFSDSDIDLYENRYLFKEITAKCLRTLEREKGVIRETPDERTLKNIVAKTLLKSVQVC